MIFCGLGRLCPGVVGKVVSPHPCFGLVRSRGLRGQSTQRCCWAVSPAVFGRMFPQAQRSLSPVGVGGVWPWEKQDLGDARDKAGGREGERGVEQPGPEPRELTRSLVS